MQGFGRTLGLSVGQPWRSPVPAAPLHGATHPCLTVGSTCEHACSGPQGPGDQSPALHVTETGITGRRFVTECCSSHALPSSPSWSHQAEDFGWSTIQAWSFCPIKASGKIRPASVDGIKQALVRGLLSLNNALQSTMAQTSPGHPICCRDRHN